MTDLLVTIALLIIESAIGAYLLKHQGVATLDKLLDEAMLGMLSPCATPASPAASCRLTSEKNLDSSNLGSSDSPQTKETP